MSNNVSVGRSAVAEWLSGNGTIGETPAQLAAMPVPVRKSVTVRADAGNSGTITIGPSASQAAGGFILAAGDTSPPIQIDDLSKVYLVGSATGQNFSFISV